MTQTTCFVFDLDDTLYPERDYVRSGFDAVESVAAARLNIERFAEACWERFLRGDRGRIFDSVLQARYDVLDMDLVRELVRTYRVHKPNIQLHADARRFIKFARRIQAPLALITDGPPESQQAKIQALALEDAFSQIVITGELGKAKSKPHPAAFELVQQAIGHAYRFVYTADNPCKDFLTPNRLGWTSVRIQRPGGLYSQAVEPTPEHAPQHTVTSLDDVRQFAK